MTTLYHNPRCSKSREALKLLEERNETVQIIRYLENPPGKRELKQLINLLNIPPIELIRTNEKEWKENFKDKELSDDDLIEAMIEFPRLMQRPVAVKGVRAVIGRPPEKVLEIL